jgi:hypothetical protein
MIRSSLVLKRRTAFSLHMGALEFHTDLVFPLWLLLRLSRYEAGWMDGWFDTSSTRRFAAFTWLFNTGRMALAAYKGPGRDLERMCRAGGRIEAGWGSQIRCTDMYWVTRGWWIGTNDISHHIQGGFHRDFSLRGSVTRSIGYGCDPVHGSALGL